MTKSALFNFVFGSVIGLAAGLAVAVFISHPVVVDAQTTVADQASTIESQRSTIAKQQELLDLREKAIVTMSNEWQASMTNPGAQLLARSGHIMNEAQCRVWAQMTNPNPAGVGPVNTAGELGVATVLYESGRAPSMRLSTSIGGVRVSLNPNLNVMSTLAPRWVIPGRIQPQMIGDTRKATYYYYDATSSQWQGPFAPERVVQ